MLGKILTTSTCSYIGSRVYVTTAEDCLKGPERAAVREPRSRIERGGDIEVDTHPPNDGIYGTSLLQSHATAPYEQSAPGVTPAIALAGCACHPTYRRWVVALRGGCGWIPAEPLWEKPCKTIGWDDIRLTITLNMGLLAWPFGLGLGMGGCLTLWVPPDRLSHGRCSTSCLMGPRAQRGVWDARRQIFKIIPVGD